jgi:cell division protein FtsQ
VAALPRALAIGPHGRRRLLALAVLAALLGAGYMFWLRDSSLVRVERVTVTGIDTADAARVRAKLTAAAREMTTLHVNADALRRAVADEPVVHSLAVHPDFPHGLKIEVVQNRPVALLVVSGREMAVAPDGTLLDGTNIAADLPIVRVGSLPSSGRIPAGPVRDRVAVAAAAPARLLSRVESVSIQHGRGAVAQLRHGPVVIFGRPFELERKWAAATAVLAQRSSQGATYIDVRMPERPVAGGLALQQDPQAQGQTPAVIAAPGSPGVVPAAPAGVSGAATQTPQTQPQPGVAATTGATPSPVTQAATPPTQAQP